jgi:sterol desaturase/sphingolipid hydroxylase (fatty acid hydroxylase superfamily)
MLKTLNNIQPIMIIVLLGLFFTLETYFPYLTRYHNRMKHTFRNLGLVLFDFLTNGLTALWYAFWMTTIQQHNWGLMNALRLGPVVAVILGVLLIDLDSYVAHFTFHKIPVLWRIHKVHHSDNELDSTSSFRFHPFEVLLQALWRTVTFVILGISYNSLIVFLTLMIPLLFIQHANIKFPDWIERTLGTVLVTSTWHKVHHSDEIENTDSHYSNLFTIWDRIFGTHNKNVDIEHLKWGLKELQEDKDQTLKRQLILPFKG